jgi:hypothetical protein
MYRIEMDRMQQYVADEFVVATPHRDLVMQRITGAGATVKAQDARLGLTLVHLSDVGRALAQVRADREAAGADPPPPPRGGPQGLQLEALLAELRALFAHGYGRWTPTIGKNRVIHGLQLFPYPSFGGSGVPSSLPATTPLPNSATTGRAGQDARVAILDTRIFPHPLLAGRFLADAASLLSGGPEVPKWWAGHATFVAGLVNQRAPGAALTVNSVLGSEGTAANIWEVATTLVGYAGSGVDVLNLSFGCFTVDGEAPLVLDRAMARLTPDVVVVAAAGNYGDADAVAGASPDDLPGPTTPIWPAAFESVVAVGANDPDGKPASFTPKVPWLDFMAPGVDVTSTYLQGRVDLNVPTSAGAHQDAGNESPSGGERDFFGVAQWRGTSFAAAAVTGAIAARTGRGERSAYQALEELRNGSRDPSSAGIHPARTPEL